MKKALSFAVALGLVAGAAHMASAAELSITGDARWRGVYSNDMTKDNNNGNVGVDFNDAAQNKTQKMDQRYRLKADVKVNDSVTVNTRFVIGDNDFGNKVPDANGVDQPNNLKLSVDTADMAIKTLGGSWTIGRQNISWGNDPLPLLVHDTPLDWIMASYGVGGITINPYMQQDKEGNYLNGDGDTTTYGTLLMGKVADTNWGLLLNYVKSSDNTAKVTGNDTGYVVDPYFNTKIGPATVLGEVSYLGGDLLKRNGKDLYAAYLAGVMGFEPVTVTGLLAYSKNGYVTSKYFMPSMLIGSEQNTAIIDFGDTSKTADSGDNSYIVGAVASVKASDKLKFGGLVAYLGAGKHGGANKDEKASLVEVDLTAEYELAQNCAYKIGVAYGDPHKLSAADDAVYVVGNSVEVKW